MFNVDYTLSRLKAMLTACQLKQAITYDVKIFYPISQGREIFISIAALFLLENFKNLINL